MRGIISLSLPSNMKKNVQVLSKSRGFSSVSSYIRHLIESDKDLITEQDLLVSVEKSRKEYKEGRAIKAGSLEELL